MTIAEERHESKTRFLQAAIRVIRVKGYTAARVEDVCEAAGLTKGSFFHHFDSKEELALAAADYWTESAGCAVCHRALPCANRPAGAVVGLLGFSQGAADRGIVLTLPA